MKIHSVKSFLEKASEIKGFRHLCTNKAHIYFYEIISIHGVFVKKRNEWQTWHKLFNLIRLEIKIALSDIIYREGDS